MLIRKNGDRGCVSFLSTFFFSAYLTVICVELYLLETLLFHNELYMLTAYMLIAKENCFYTNVIKFVGVIFLKVQHFENVQVFEYDSRL